MPTPVSPRASNFLPPRTQRFVEKPTLAPRFPPFSRRAGRHRKKEAEEKEEAMRFALPLCEGESVCKICSSWRKVESGVGVHNEGVGGGKWHDKRDRHSEAKQSDGQRSQRRLLPSPPRRRQGCHPGRCRSL